MKNLSAAFVTEIMKLRRSAIFWIIMCFFIFISLMMGLLMYIALHPNLASKLGILAAKASFFRENSWDAYFEILNQTMATVGIIGFGFVTAWVFGREYTEQTIKDILALPVSRSAVVVSKFIIVTLWCSLLIICMFITSTTIGCLIDIPDWSGAMMLKSASKFFTTAFFALLLSTTVAFIAGIGRGIIAPIGFSILVLIIAQFVALSGLGPYFPWAIPGVYTVEGVVEGMQLVVASYIILVATGLAGFLGTIAWWRFADQH